MSGNPLAGIKKIPLELNRDGAVDYAAWLVSEQVENALAGKPTPIGPLLDRAVAVAAAAQLVVIAILNEGDAKK